MEQDFGEDLGIHQLMSSSSIFFHVALLFVIKNSTETTVISTLLNIRVPFLIPPLVTRPSPKTWNLPETQAKTSLATSKHQFFMCL